MTARTGSFAVPLGGAIGIVRPVPEVWCANAWTREPSGVDVWRSGVVLRVDAGGRVAAVETDRPRPDRGVRLDGLVVPGMPNLHGHAFQRALVGRVEHGRLGGADSFWTWREGMYGLAAAVDRAELEAIAAMLYVEALEAGFTRMGEFHYLTHPLDGPPEAMAAALVSAADLASMPLTLLPVAYLAGGFGRPLGPTQGRFGFDGVQAFLRYVERLVELVPDPHRLGVAPHSLRAVPPACLPDLVAGVDAMLGPDAPKHIHVAEQPAEVEACLDATGQRPMTLLFDRVEVDRSWCLVHATHGDAGERAVLARSGAVAGLCPTTEANLGDGHFPLAAHLAAGGRFGIGSDSHASVDPAEELRWLEYQARLDTGRRTVLPARAGPPRLGDLWGRAVDGGAQALGEVGGLAVSARADLVELDPEHPRLLAASDPAAKLDGWLLGSCPGAVRSVWVGGAPVVENGRHRARERVEAGFRSALGRLGLLLALATCWVPIRPARAEKPSKARIVNGQLVLPPRTDADVGGDVTGIPIRCVGNVVLIEEVYESVLAYAGWDDAPEGPARAMWIQITLEDFLHASGYDLATVEVNELSSGGYELVIDEGRLDKIIFQNVDPWTTVQLIFMLDLPGKVYNKELLERRLADIRQKLNIERADARVVPTEEPESVRLQLRDPRIIEGLTLLSPGEPHELRIQLQRAGRQPGFELGLGVQAPDGIIVNGSFLLPGVLVREDTVQVDAQLGVRLTDIGRVPGNRIGLSRAGASVRWSTPPAFDALRLTASVGAELEARRREDLELINYFFAPARAALGLALVLDGFRLEGSGGIEQRTFFGARNEDPDADPAPVLEVTEGNNLRSFAEAALGWEFNRDRLRRDRPHEVRIEGRYLWPLGGEGEGVIRRARIWYQNTATFGFEELRYRLQGVWLDGNVPFYGEVAMGDGFLRSAFQGSVFAKRVGGLGIEYRFSLSRDTLKLSLFNDAAVYESLDQVRDPDGLAAIDNFGVGLHILILDAFQVDGYLGAGIRTDGQTDVGVSLNVAQAF